MSPPAGAVSAEGVTGLLAMEPSTSEFVKSVADHWGTLTTGGVIVALVGILERVFLRRSISWWLYTALMICAVLVACYQTWADERQKNIKLSQIFGAERLEITYLKLKKYGKSAKYSLDAWISNTGPQPTSTPIPIKHDPIYTHSDLSTEGVEDIMHQLENNARTTPIPPSIMDNLIYPGKPSIFTIDEDFLTDEQIAEIDKGTLAVYVFVILKYRDKAMGPNHSRGTESTIYYAGGTDYWHNLVNEVVDWDQ